MSYTPNTITTSIPPTGIFSMASISNAFPNTGNNLLAYPGLYPPPFPSVKPISFNNFRGITAPTPTFNKLLTAAINPGAINMTFTGYTNSNTIAGFSGGTGTITLSNYIDTNLYNPGMIYKASTTFPAFLTITDSVKGILNIANTSVINTSTYVVTACNKYGNYANIPIKMNIINNIAPLTPSITGQTQSYGDIDLLIIPNKSPITWSFNLTNVTSWSILTSTNITNCYIGNLNNPGSIGYVYGDVLPNTTYSIQFVLNYAQSGYTTNTLNSATYTLTSPLAAPAPTLSVPTLMDNQITNGNIAYLIDSSGMYYNYTGVGFKTRIYYNYTNCYTSYGGISGNISTSNNGISAFVEDNGILSYGTTNRIYFDTDYAGTVSFRLALYPSTTSININMALKNIVFGRISVTTNINLTINNLNTPALPPTGWDSPTLLFPYPTSVYDSTNCLNFTSTTTAKVSNNGQSAVLNISNYLYPINTNNTGYIITTNSVTYAGGGDSPINKFGVLMTVPQNLDGQKWTCIIKMINLWGNHTNTITIIGSSGAGTSTTFLNVTR